MSLAERFYAHGRPRVAVVGDFITDADVHGECTRFAQEAAGCPVFKIAERVTRDGGVGAVARMAEALGADVVLRHGVPSTKARYLAGGRQILRVDDDRGGGLDPARAAAAVAGANVVLVADYGKGTCTPEVLRAVIDAAAGEGIPCVVDPPLGADWGTYCGATIKCNVAEYASRRHAPHSPRRVIVTDGPRGMTMSHNDAGWKFPTTPVTAVDVTGCGDVVLAAVGVCVAGGMSWEDACAVANVAAGIEVTRHGAVPVSWAEVVLGLVGGKQLPAALLPAVRAAADAGGKKVVLANGCFDLLHPGHLHCLRAARDQGDVLVVAVNDDVAVRALKGPGRPLWPLTYRGDALEALACVDLVVAFGTDVLSLVHALRPDVLVKGGDYAGTATAVPGAAEVASWGGRVHLTTYLEGFSTTNLHRRP